MANKTHPPRKNFSTTTGKNPPVQGQLQEKLQQIKDLYVKSSPSSKQKIKKSEKQLSLEKMKKDKALRHQKEQAHHQKEAAQERFQKMKQALEWLCEQYPLCFNSYEPKPLKRRIEKDILATLPEGLPFSRLHIREALAYYTKRPKYRDTLATATHRYNLEGEVVEEVIPDHQQLAATQLDHYNTRKKQILAEKKKKHQEWKERQKKTDTAVKEK